MSSLPPTDLLESAGAVTRCPVIDQAGGVVRSGARGEFGGLIPVRPASGELEGEPVTRPVAGAGTASATGSFPEVDDDFPGYPGLDSLVGLGDSRETVGVDRQ